MTQSGGPGQASTGHEETGHEGAPEDADSQRVRERAHLLPEEEAAGSDDPEAQAEAILAESDERTADPEGSRGES